MHKHDQFELDFTKTEMISTPAHTTQPWTPPSGHQTYANRLHWYPLKIPPLYLHGNQLKKVFSY